MIKHVNIFYIYAYTIYIHILLLIINFDGQLFRQKKLFRETLIWKISAELT